MQLHKSTSFQLPAVSFLCRRRENMKFPSRREQPGNAHTALHRRLAAGLPALCCPSPVHTTWEEPPPTPSLPATPTVTCFLGTTARFGPFFVASGALPRVEHSWNTLPAANILLLLFCPGPPAWKLQAEQGHLLHIATIQPWHARTPEELT